MKKNLSLALLILLGLFFSFSLFVPQAKAFTTEQSISAADQLQPASIITYDDELVVNNIARFNSIYIGKQDEGGVTFFNGTIINSTTNEDDVDNPVTFGDNVRIDGRLHRGLNYGPDLGDNMPLIVNDDMQVTGELTVGNLIGTDIVNSNNIANGTITSTDIAGETITVSNLANNSITSAKINDGTVITADLANNSITSAKINDGTVITADLANNSITSAKINDGTVIGSDISSSANLSIASTTLTGNLTASNVYGNNVTNKTTESVTYYVETPANGGSDTTGNGSQSAPYATIQKAVDELPDVINHSCHINVGPGTFEESVYIKKMISENSEHFFFYITGSTAELLAATTAENGTTRTIISTGSFTGQDYTGKWVEILSGAGYRDIGTDPLLDYFSNYHPILSNTNDVLTLPYDRFTSFDATTQFRIVDIATTITKEDDLAYSFINFSPALELNLSLIKISGHFGLGNYGNTTIRSCAFPADGGYNGISNLGGKVWLMQNYFSGFWNNAAISDENAGGVIKAYYNYVNGAAKGLEVQNGAGHIENYYSYIEDTTVTAIRSSGNNRIYDNRSIFDGNNNIYLVGTGGLLHSVNGAVEGDANTKIAAVNPGGGTILYDGTNITATSEYTFSDGSGMIIDTDNDIVVTGENYVGSDQSLEAADAVTVSYREIERVVGNGGAVTLSSTPSIDDSIKDGQELTIQGTHDTNTVTLQDESNLANSGLQLAGGIDMTLEKGDMIRLKYDSGDDKWYEISRSNN